MAASAIEALKPDNYQTLTISSLLFGLPPRTQGVRRVPMKVLCLGFSRTGTISLRTALYRLGYGPCYHMLEFISHPEHAEFWEKLVAAKWENGPPVTKAEWDAALGDYQAGADNPFAVFVEELIAVYPDAKVILTNKDPDAYWRSWRKACEATFNVPYYFILLRRLFDPFGTSFESRRDAVMNRLLAHQFPNGGCMNEQEAKRVFVEHYENVRRLVPKERLLEYRVEQGWEPLCEFLGELVPEDEFPKGNTVSDFQHTVHVVAKVESLKRLFSLPGLALMGGTCAVVVYTVRAFVGWNGLLRTSRLY